MGHVVWYVAPSGPGQRPSLCPVTYDLPVGAASMGQAGG